MKSFVIQLPSTKSMKLFRFKTFYIYSNSQHCFVSFMNASTIYPFLVPKIADVIILFSCKVIKTFNYHLNHKCKYTRATRKTIRDHFDSTYRSLTLSSPIYILNNYSYNTGNCKLQILSEEKVPQTRHA